LDVEAVSHDKNIMLIINYFPAVGTPAVVDATVCAFSYVDYFISEKSLLLFCLANYFLTIAFFKEKDRFLILLLYPLFLRFAKYLKILAKSR